MILTDETIQKSVDSDPLIFIYFWAEWCSPCKHFSPVVEDLKKEKNLNLFKMNADENPISSEKFKLTGIPTIIVIKDGVEVNRIIGGMPKHKLADRLKEWL